MKTNGKLEYSNNNKLPILEQQGQQEGCCVVFNGYDASLLMSETAKLRKLITKRGTLEILIPLNSIKYYFMRTRLVFLLEISLFIISAC